MQTSLENKSNYDLRYIIEYVSESRAAAGEQLLKQSPSNDDLRYIIEYVSESRAAAWEQLLKQSPSNDDLRYIIRYVSESRAAAWEQLLKQSPSNDDLRYIIRYVSESRAAAARLLRSNLGFPMEVDEVALIKQIADIVLKDNKKLRMGAWHCKTAHCVAGWACVLNPVAGEIEKAHNTEMAGFATIPSLTNYFYSEDKVVLEVLKKFQEAN
jgi:hypothetical protein